MASYPSQKQIGLVRKLLKNGLNYPTIETRTGVSAYFVKQIECGRVTEGKDLQTARIAAQRSRDASGANDTNGIIVTKGENVNLQSVSYKGRDRITTVEELLQVAQVDTEEWEVESFVTNQWEMGYMEKVGEDSYAPNAYPLYQVKANLKRRKVLPVDFAPVAPISISVKFPAKPKPATSGIKKCVVIPDIQCGYRRDLMFGTLQPFHDRRVISVGLQILQDVNPDVVVFLGDNMDCPDWSLKYLSSPECAQTTQTALIELGWLYGKVRAMLPNAEIHVIEGNHDLRMQTAVIANLKQAYGLRAVDQLVEEPALSMERLLNLKQLGIEYHGPYPHGKYRLNSNFIFQHGHLVRAGSGKTVAAMANDLRRNEAVGHLHRLELATKTMWTADGIPKVYQAWSFGTWASIKPGIVPGVKSENNWQNAIGVIDFEDSVEADSDLHDLSTVTAPLIYRDTAIYNGKRYKAQDEDEMVEGIIKDTGWDVRMGYFARRGK